MRNCLITGADGMIGSALAAQLSAKGVDCITTSRRVGSNGMRLDLAAPPENWPDIPKVDVAFFCAAAAKLDACENDPESTRLVNVTHMQALAEHVQAKGGFIVFLSTSQVFDGSKSEPRVEDAVCPVSQYGRQKAEFERWLLAHPQSAAVLRLTKVVNGPLPVVAKWRTAWEVGETVEAFADLVFSPLPLASALEALETIARNRLTGISQLSGDGQLSYFDLARKLAPNPDLVKPGSALAAGIRPQFLPRFATLACSDLPSVSVPSVRDYAG